MTGPSPDGDLQQRLAAKFAEIDGRDWGYDHAFVSTYGTDAETDAFVDAALAELEPLLAQHRDTEEKLRAEISYRSGVTLLVQQDLEVMQRQRDVLSLRLRGMARKVVACRAELDQAVEEWGRNDEQVLAENQRLDDDNEWLSEACRLTVREAANVRAERDRLLRDATPARRKLMDLIGGDWTVEPSLTDLATYAARFWGDDRKEADQLRAEVSRLSAGSVIPDDAAEQIAEWLSGRFPNSMSDSKPRTAARGVLKIVRGWSAATPNRWDLEAAFSTVLQQTGDAGGSYNDMASAAASHLLQASSNLLQPLEQGNSKLNQNLDLAATPKADGAGGPDDPSLAVLRAKLQDTDDTCHCVWESIPSSRRRRTYQCRSHKARAALGPEIYIEGEDVPVPPSGATDPAPATAECWREGDHIPTGVDQVIGGRSGRVWHRQCSGDWLALELPGHQVRRVSEFSLFLLEAEVRVAPPADPAPTPEED